MPDATTSGGSGLGPPGGSGGPITAPVPAGTPVPQRKAFTPWGYDDKGRFAPNTNPDNRFGAQINPGVITNPFASPQATLPNVKADLGNATGILVNNNNEYVALWITDFITDFEITGITAQSQGYRQFFPRAFTQPRITLVGNCANDLQFNRLAEFVHTSQLNYLTSQNLYSNPPLQLMMHADPDWMQGGKQFGPDRAHIGWLVTGYIDKIQAGGIRHNPGPQFELTFVAIYNSALSPGTVSLYTDVEPVEKSTEITSWMDVIKSTAFTPKGSSTPATTVPSTVTQLAAAAGTTITTIVSDFFG